VPEENLQATRTIDLNSASRDDLANLGEIGRELAEDLLRLRESQGGVFRSWDDLLQIPGITPELLDEIRARGATLGDEQPER
jgi:DNA uptake protein ComE-like DNA-binding protein